MNFGALGTSFGGLGRGGAGVSSLALAFLAAQGGEGLSMFSSDDTLAIVSSGDPTDNYQGTPGAKLTTTRASTAAYWTAAGLIAYAATGTLRRDFDPRLAATPERCGYLIEEARTNLALRSEEIDNASWTKTSVTVTADADTAPDSTATMDRLVSTVDSGSAAGASQTFTGTAAAYTLSVFAKRVSGLDWLRLALTTSASATNRNAWFNLATGELGTKEANVTDYKIVSCGNGVYRCSITVTCAATTETAYIRLAGADTSNSVLAIGDTVSVWGAQVELGSFASSYIPTAGSTVTRAADLVTLAGTLFPLSQTEGTLYAKWMMMGTSASAQYILVLDGGTTSTIIFPYRNTNLTVGYTINNGGNTVNLTSTATVANLAASKVAAGYKTDDSAVAMAGETVQTDISCALPTTTKIVFGNRSSDSGRALNGWLFEAAYFPTRKDNSQLEELIGLSPSPGGGESLDFSDANNSMYIGQVI
jgi:hypothetical protein